MTICHERKLIFVHIPKNAGTSIIKAMGVENIFMDKTIEEYKELIAPTISSAIKPDISIKDIKDNKIMYIEVLSERLVRTIRFFDLLLQLLYIRRVNK